MFDSKTMSRKDITSMQKLILIAMRQDPEMATARQISEFVGCSKPGVMAGLEGLERLGFVSIDRADVTIRPIASNTYTLR